MLLQNHYIDISCFFFFSINYILTLYIFSFIKNMSKKVEKGKFNVLIMPQ